MTGLSQEFKFRDVFNRRVVRALADSIARVWPDFPAARFQKQALIDFEALNFGARSKQIELALHESLPDDFERACNILIDALGPELPEPGITVWDAFIVMPQCAFVSTYGREHYDLSMRALYEMTKRFSAEGDLRTFLEIDYTKTMQLLHKWTKDKSPHVRRLVSEGTRPRLPLAPRITRFVKDPTPVIELLDKLRGDPELYVRRSVANNLNDIGKDHPDLVVKTLSAWRKKPTPELEWIVSHATRSLVKKGHRGALALHGSDKKPSVKVGPIRFQNKSVPIGDFLVFEAELTAVGRSEQKLTVDFIIHYLKKNGEHAPKVFKLRTLTLKPKEKVIVGRRVHMRHTSGRKLNPGPHEIQLQINGFQFPRAQFRLTKG